MVDETRRKFLKTGATAAAMAVVSPALAQQSGQPAPAGKFYERGPVRIHYQEWGAGFPLLLIAGGGLGGSRFQGLTNPFDAVGEFRNEYRCIGYDVRTSTGLSTGPLEIDRPWEMMADDQIGLMDHLGIDKFMVMGFCVGGPLIWNLLKRAPDRVAGAVIAQPSGCREEDPLLLFNTNMQGWGPEYVKRHPEVTMAQVEQFLTNMYKKPADFVWCVTRDFVKQCKNPVLILPDDIPPHPYKVAWESAMLAPNAELSMFPWKEPKERMPLAIRQIRSFLRAHRVASATA